MNRFWLFLLSIACLTMLSASLPSLTTAIPLQSDPPKSVDAAEFPFLAQGAASSTVQAPKAPAIAYELQSITWKRQDEVLGTGKTLTYSDLLWDSIPVTYTVTLDVPPMIVEGRGFKTKLTTVAEGFPQPWDVVIMGWWGDSDWNIRDWNAHSGATVTLVMDADWQPSTVRPGWFATVTAIPGFANGDTTNIYCPDGCLSPPMYPMFKTAFGSSKTFSFQAHLGWNAVEPTVDLEADGLEITQAVQDLYNTVDLVAKKRTFVRFHAHANTGNHVSYAQIKVDNGTSIAYLTPTNPNIHVRSVPDRAMIDHAYLFELPSIYCTGTVTITAQLNPTTAARSVDPAESDFSNNDLTEVVTFNPVPPLDLIVYRIGYTSNNMDIYPGRIHVQMLRDWITQAYPVSQVQVVERTQMMEKPATVMTGTLTYPTCEAVNTVLDGKRFWDRLFGSVGANTHYYGMVADRAGFMRGCAMGIPSFVASGPAGANGFAWDTDGSYGDWYGAHELAHTYNRFHAMFCRAEGGVPYPYANGKISGDQSGPDALYGFNISKQVVYPPTWSDLMTYCSWQWMSDFTTEGLMSYLQSPSAKIAALPLDLAQVDRLLVTGVIDSQAHLATLEPIYLIPGVTEVDPRIPGDYAIVLRNGTGDELARYAFTPETGQAGPPLPGAEAPVVQRLLFTELVPFVPGTNRVEIVGPDSSVLGGVQAGASAPQVTLLAPNGGETLSGATVDVSWSAQDPDGDPLHFTLQFSPDNGATWEVVAQNLTVTSMGLDATNIHAAAQAKFRVWVSDGIHTASDESDGSFAVANRPPLVSILQPEDGVTIAAGQTLGLVGSVDNSDQIPLTPAQLTWVSDLDGALGFGEKVSIASLSVGSHTISFQADSGSGSVVSVTVRVNVVGQISELPPIASSLMVGPNPLILAGANLVTGTLAVENANLAVALPWAATTDANWLSVKTAAGVTPAQLVVEADGRTLPNGSYLGSVTLTSVQLPGQTTTIQVGFSVQRFRVLLPLLRKP